jgi:hypothetical protein
MTEELIHEIEVMNRLEKELQLKWGRGEAISEEFMTRLDKVRATIRSLQDNPVTSK